MVMKNTWGCLHQGQGWKGVVGSGNGYEKYMGLSSSGQGQGCVVGSGNGYEKYMGLSSSGAGMEGYGGQWKWLRKIHGGGGGG